MVAELYFSRKDFFRPSLTGSRFTRCGHAELNGGAVFHSDHARIIKDCCFDSCLGGYGGAIRVAVLRNIDKCEFISCQSAALQEQDAADVAVFAESAKAPIAISGCVFRNTSLVIGESKSKDAKFVMSSQFECGNIYYHSKYLFSDVHCDCSFSDGLAIDKKLIS